MSNECGKRHTTRLAPIHIDLGAEKEKKKKKIKKKQQTHRKATSSIARHRFRCDNHCHTYTKTKTIKQRESAAITHIEQHRQVDQIYSDLFFFIFQRRAFGVRHSSTKSIYKFNVIKFNRFGYFRFVCSIARCMQSCGVNGVRTSPTRFNTHFRATFCVCALAQCAQRSHLCLPVCMSVRACHATFEWIEINVNAAHLFVDFVYLCISGNFPLLFLIESIPLAMPMTMMASYRVSSLMRLLRHTLNETTIYHIQSDSR